MFKKTLITTTLLSSLFASTLTVRVDLGSIENLKLNNRQVFNNNYLVNLEADKLIEIKKQNLGDDNLFKGAIIIYPTTNLTINKGYIYSPQFLNFFKINALYGLELDNDKDFYSYLILLDRLQYNKFLFFYDEVMDTNYNSYLNILLSLKEQIELKIKNQIEKKNLISKVNFLINILKDSRDIFINLNTKKYTQNYYELSLREDTATRSYFWGYEDSYDVTYSTVINNKSLDKPILTPFINILNSTNIDCSFNGSLLNITDENNHASTFNILKIKDKVPNFLNSYQNNFSTALSGFFISNAREFNNLNFDNINFIVSNTVASRNLYQLYRGNATEFLYGVEPISLTLQYKYNKYTGHLRTFYPLIDIKGFYKPVETTNVEDLNRTIEINEESAIANNYIPLDFTHHRIPPALNIQEPQNNILYIKYTPISGDYLMFSPSSVKTLLNQYYGGDFSNIDRHDLYVYNIEDGNITGAIKDMSLSDSVRLDYLINSTPLFGITCTDGKCTLSQRNYQVSSSFVDFDTNNIKYLYDKTIDYSKDHISNLNAISYQIREIDSIFIDKKVFDEENFRNSLDSPIDLPIEYFTPAKADVVMQQDYYKVKNYEKYYRMCGDENTTLYRYRDENETKPLDCIYNILPNSKPAEALIDKTYSVYNQGQVDANKEFRYIGSSDGIEFGNGFSGDTNFVSSKIIRYLNQDLYNSIAPDEICVAMGKEIGCKYSDIPLTICPADNFLKAHSIELSNPRKPNFFNKGYAYSGDINNTTTYPRLVNVDIVALYSYNGKLPSVGNYVYDNNNPFYKLFLESLYKYVFFKRFNTIEGREVTVYNCDGNYQLEPCATECPSE